jgi:hypothetical protein
VSLAIIYVNSKDENGRYVKEAANSANSFRGYIPDAKYYLYTNYLSTDYDTQAFDEIVQTEFYVPEKLKNRVHLNGQMIVKHKAMLELKEDYILYLGADTYALKPDVKELVKLLDKFDLALTHAPIRINTEIDNTSIPEVSKCFSEMNCDLILYKNTIEVRDLIGKWKEAYLDDLFSHPHDQGSFRYLVYNSNLRVYILPPEYNYREHLYREDTIILQNRFSLQSYLNKKGESLNFITKIKNIFNF